MDAVLENVKNSFEVGVRKVLITGTKRGNLMTQSNKSKPKICSRIFNTPLCEICQRECSTVPNLVKDICNFIQEKYLHLEGIFRISASSIQIKQLRNAYEDRSFTNENVSGICKLAGVDGHAAANVLKQFFRQLPEPLIPDEVLKISLENKCLSDDAFAKNVRSVLSSWPAPHKDTLQYLLSFLQLIMRNQDNRMNVTGLAVVFGPNVFRIPDGAEGLEIQSLANHTFERLLITSDVICDVKDDQGYLNMTPSPPSCKVVPSRPAPPVPLQARPLPPPPVPEHLSTAELVVPSITSSPSVPVRSKSLNHRLAAGDSLDSNIFTSGSYSEHSETEGVFFERSEQYNLFHDNSDAIEEVISDVVRKHLFTADSSSSCQEDDMTSSSPKRDGVSATSLLPSLTQNRNKGPIRRKPSRQHRRSIEEFNNDDDAHQPVPIPRKDHLIVADANISDSKQVEHVIDEIATTSASDSHLSLSMVIPAVTILKEQSTPTSNAKPAPKPRVNSVAVEISAPTSSAKLAADTFVEEKKSVDDVKEIVPPLDLSGVMSSDEVRPKPLPRKERDSPSRIKRRKRKRSKSSPNQMKTSPTTPSDPISIPTPISTDRLSIADDTQPLLSPPDGCIKWRDAWSTDEEGISTAVAMENGFTRSGRHAADKDVNIEFAPSSPKHHVMEMYSSKRRLQRRHHHPSNRSSRESPDVSSAPESAKEDDYSHLVVSLDKIQTALRANRQESGRPEDLTLMTREQIRSEKLAMQRELLNHEEKYGRPVKKTEKDIMRGLYERYRTVKRLLADSLSLPFNVQALDDVRKEDYDFKRTETIDEFAITQTLPVSNLGNEVEGAASDCNIEASVSISGNLSVSELRKQQKEAKGQRKRLRRRLKEFEKEIEQQYNRKITQADKVVMATEYDELKALKAKIRLLEALINKQNTTA